MSGVSSVTGEIENGKMVYRAADGTVLMTLDGVAKTVTMIGSKYFLNVDFADIGTAQSKFVVAPDAGVITGLSIVNSGANAGTKTVMTAKIATVAVTHPAWEVAVTAAAGTKTTVAPTAANVVAAGAVIEILADGGSNIVTPATVTIEITRT